MICSLKCSTGFLSKNGCSTHTGLVAEIFSFQTTIMASVTSSQSHGGYHKNFKQITLDRLLHEILRTDTKSRKSWEQKILITDDLTVKILSHSYKVSEVYQEGIFLVEHLYKRRSSFTSLDAIYFIQPIEKNVNLLISDMDGYEPLYRKAFVFFSSPIPKEYVSRIISKDKPALYSRIGAIREMNLEYVPIDSQGFLTNNEKSLEELYGGDDEETDEGTTCLNVIATRIATVFASLREFPCVRYRAAKSLDATATRSFRDLVPAKLAAGVLDCLMEYKKTIPDKFPQTETCQLLILDRSLDQIAPIIHEWTYDAMCHDLLNLEGNKYVKEVSSKTDCPTEEKEVLLDEYDHVWLELRHAHIAEVGERLHEQMTNFISKNKAAQIQLGSRNHEELSTWDMQNMVQTLPQYSKEIDKLTLHIEIAGKIDRSIRDLGLKELGQLEQNLVFGEAGLKDVLKYLTKKDDTTGFVGCTRENKLRLLMILAAIYPEKFEGDKGLRLMKLAQLPLQDWSAVNNLRLLEGSSSHSKQSPTSPFSLTFEKNHATRKDREGEEEKTWQLSRFYPIIEELIEKLSKGELSEIDYPLLSKPSPTSPPKHHQTPAANLVRSKRTPTWARCQPFHDKYSNDSKKMGQRIFVFIVGGATRSELRVCHKLTSKLKREVVLGSTSLDDPLEFIMKLKMLRAHDEI
ncbi:SNARE-interacting protein KEULE-like isoform X2 [Humulus lupulus]|uniref:SNARE-interacting protein KEULE-like isoform X2 n=1 Tax=Humulus lupulus TaxID=3486 RepID=UPI002B401D6A|nr:SNARE-interacting protein KEULE-like isoform X2 [Humulus lupulus]